jgi:hypothetical protein
VPAVEVHRFTHHKAAVTKLAVSVDGTFLATAGADKLVYVFNTGTFQMVTVLGPHPGEPTGLSFVKDNSVLVSMLANQSSRNNVAWWDWQNKTGLKKKFSDADISLYAIQASPTGAKFAVTMGDSNARTYNLNDNGRQGLVSPRETLKCLCVAFSPTGRYLRMASGGGSVRWQVEGQLGPAGHINPESEAVTTCMAYLPDGTQFVSSHDDGQLRIWREEEGTIVARIAAHKGEASSVAVSSDGKFLVSGGHDQSVRVWNIATQELVKECAGHSGAVTSVVFLKSDVVASSSQDGTVRIWSLKDNAVAAAPSQPAPVRPAVPAPQPSLPNETPAPAPAAVKALPPPEESQVTEAIELMRKVFKDEYAAKKPADKLKLSKQLLDQARDEKGEPAERFAMLQEALRLAIEVGDIDASLLAARSSAASFRQPADFEVQVVKRLLDSVSGVPENAGLASAALDWADQKRAKENFDEADQLAKLASRAATKGRSTPLQKNARELGDRIRREQERFLAYQLAVKVLKDQRDDAAANLTIGRYFCFTRGEWPTGIKHLALGSGSLKVVADKELAAEKLKQESKKPLETSDLIALAEQWQSAAADLPESERQHALAAAIYWYEQALSSLTGLQKLKVEQAMKKIAPTGIQRK